MKRRGENLQKHYRQAFDYWSRLVPNRPRYVVLCNFDEFRVYDFDTDLDAPKDTVALKDLPQRWGALAFLAPGSPKPTFEHDREKVTREAADCLAECFRKLVKRGVPRESAAAEARGDAKVMQNRGCRRKSLIDMERAKGFEPSTLTLAT